MLIHGSRLIACHSLLILRLSSMHLNAIGGWRNPIALVEELAVGGGLRELVVLVEQLRLHI